MKKVFKFILLLIIYASLLALACLAIVIFANKTGHIEGFKIGNFTIISNNKQKSFDEIVGNGLTIDDENINSNKGKADKFYYNQLSDIAKFIYDTLVENKEEIKTGTLEIDLKSSDIDSLLLQSDGMEILRDEYQNAIDSLKYDDMSWFYIDFTKMALKTTTYTRGNAKWFDVSLGVMDGYDNYLQDGIDAQSIDKILSKIEDKRDNILKDINGSDYQKIKQVHDWLVENIDYDETYNLNNNRNIYGTLIAKKAVCEGYAKTAKYLLDELNIPCILVTGTAVNAAGEDENHMWNYVELGGLWYSLDVTWDDPILINGGSLSEESKYKYFCQGDNIYQNHTLEYIITEGGQQYEYPELFHKEIEENEE